MKTSKRMSEMEECEIRNIQLTNEVAELRTQLSVVKNKDYTRTKQLETELKHMRDKTARLTEQLCEWVCLECDSEYYGPSAIDKGSFKCLTATCNNRYCVPKKYLVNTDNESDTENQEAA